MAILLQELTRFQAFPKLATRFPTRALPGRASLTWWLKAGAFLLLLKALN